MAQYRLLSPHYIGTRYFEAGEVVSDVGPSGLLPSGWEPTQACDPLDADAIQRFWDAGPKVQGAGQAFLSQGLWGSPVRALVYWEVFDEHRWVLTGAGASLGPKVPTHIKFEPQ